MRLVEVYTSVQGEGPNTGDATTFVRFGGCNLRCSGWGMGTLPDGSPVPGCDTTFAVYPQWSGTWDRESVDEVVAQVPDLPRRICLTGGEPLIQKKEEMAHLVEQLQLRGHVFDLFTNGTQRLPVWAVQDFTTVVMDWKLPGSGETEFDEENLGFLGKTDAIKFVCKDRDDFDEALRRAKVVEERSDAERWFGPVWRVLDPALLTEWLTTEYPEGRLNIQTHKYIWDPDERRR